MDNKTDFADIEVAKAHYLSTFRAWADKQVVFSEHARVTIEVDPSPWDVYFTVEVSLPKKNWRIQWTQKADCLQLPCCVAISSYLLAVLCERPEGLTTYKVN